MVHNDVLHGGYIYCKKISGCSSFHGKVGSIYSIYYELYTQCVVLWLAIVISFFKVNSYASFTNIPQGCFTDTVASIHDMNILSTRGPQSVSYFGSSLVHIWWRWPQVDLTAWPHHSLTTTPFVCSATCMLSIEIPYMLLQVVRWLRATVGPTSYNLSIYLKKMHLKSKLKKLILC